MNILPLAGGHRRCRGKKLSDTRILYKGKVVYCIGRFYAVVPVVRTIFDGVVKTSIYFVVCPVAILDILHV